MWILSANGADCVVSQDAHICHIFTKLLIYLAGLDAGGPGGATRDISTVQKLHNVGNAAFVCSITCHYPPLRAPAARIGGAPTPASAAKGEPCR